VQPGILALLLTIFTLPALGHPGGLNAADCHNNSSRAQYHCHPEDSSGERGEAVPLADIEGKVVAVFDGDTIKVLTFDQQSFKIRLAGIDAPERDQAYGVVAKQHLAAMVSGQQVRVETIKHDRYGRILAKVWVRPADCPACGKTLNTNHAQILGGMAWWYRYYGEEQSEEDRGRYESAEQEARARKWGLWAETDPVPPWDWRRRN
jgi:endonuclease YncB( thermonuclease family)